MLEQENDLSLASGFERGSKNKDLSEINSELDSGFLSGPQQIFSGELSSGTIDSIDLKSKESRNNNRSSSTSTKSQSQQKTVSADCDSSVDLGISADLSSSQMKSGGGETGLSDWFHNLNIKDSPTINNLDATTKEKIAVSTTITTANNVANQQSKINVEQLWKICYQQDNEGDTQLHLAIINGMQDIIWAVIRLAPAPWLLDLKNDDAQAPIHLAALTGQSSVVRRLVISGAKASIRDGDGNTALHLACINNDFSTIEALLKPITAAELKEHNRYANQLPQPNSCRKLSIDLEQRNFYGENCVHIAAQRNQSTILKMLVDEGADINAREGRAGYTPLHIAVENENVSLVEFILKECKNTINTETLCYRQITAYQLGCELDNLEIMKKLKDFGCGVISPPDSDYEDSDDSADGDFD